MDSPSFCSSHPVDWLPSRWQEAWESLTFLPSTSVHNGHVPGHLLAWSGGISMGHSLFTVTLSGDSSKGLPTGTDLSSSNTLWSGGLGEPGDEICLNLHGFVFQEAQDDAYMSFCCL
jgi:hypothetical protein